MPDPLSEAEVSRAVAELAGLSDEAAVEDWRIAHLGRKSRLIESLRALGRLPREERAGAGQRLNGFKVALQTAHKERADALKAARTERLAALDVSLPGRPFPEGGLHPITLTERAIVDAFAGMGFHVVEGPEVETEYYNFDALRIPADHPARDSMDTFYLETGEGEAPLLLRTHTSPNQIRFMERRGPPVRVIAPGRTYRNEATDATHEWMITQTEVLAVDRGLTLAHLKGTLYQFVRRLFGEREIRFRCDYFPFVEPGVEVSISSPDGWIEILGAGMVHPEILANMGYDPDVFTGFAAGLGVERIAMLRHGIRDIRRFYENDLRFLTQF